MNSHINKTPIFLYIAALMSVSLACGVSKSLPNSQNTPEVLVIAGNPTSTSQPVQNHYEVTAESLQIRTGAGEEFEAVGFLNYGKSVTCYTIEPAQDGGLWCKHELGWSNIRFMKGK